MEEPSEPASLPLTWSWPASNFLTPSPPFHPRCSCLFRSLFTSVAGAGPMGPEVWVVAGSEAVRASGESRRRAPSACCPSHTTSHLISSDTTPIPQWVVLSALFIDLAVESRSACGRFVRQRATRPVFLKWSIVMFGAGTVCLDGLGGRNVSPPIGLASSKKLLDDDLKALPFLHTQNNGNQMPPLTRSTGFFRVNHYQKVSRRAPANNLLNWARRHWKKPPSPAHIAAVWFLLLPLKSGNRDCGAIVKHAGKQFLSLIQVKNYSVLSQKTP